jgi:hypothetical protein
MGAEREPATPPARRGGVGTSLKRVGLLAAMAVATINVWTGSPLFGLWVGSRVQGSGPSKMGAILAAFATIGILSIALTRLIAALSARYAELSGQGRERRTLPWLRSMRGERAHDSARGHMSAPDLVIVACVVLAVVAFEIWFFFFSGSPIGGSSGRG